VLHRWPQEGSLARGARGTPGTGAWIFRRRFYRRRGQGVGRGGPAAGVLDREWLQAGERRIVGGPGPGAEDISRAGQQGQRLLPLPLWAGTNPAWVWARGDQGYTSYQALRGSAGSARRLLLRRPPGDRDGPRDSQCLHGLRLSPAVAIAISPLLCRQPWGHLLLRVSRRLRCRAACFHVFACESPLLRLCCGGRPLCEMVGRLDGFSSLVACCQLPW